MDPEGNVPEVVPKSVLNQTDISTGIGPTGTDTPAPKDIMPHADHLVCLLSVHASFSYRSSAHQMTHLLIYVWDQLTQLF